MTALTAFLADLPDAERDTVLEFLSSEDSENRIIKFARIAHMGPDAQKNLLKVIGIRSANVRSALNQAFGLLGQHSSEIKQVLEDLTTVREGIEAHIWKPLKQLLERDRRNHEYFRNCDCDLGLNWFCRSVRGKGEGTFSTYLVPRRNALEHYWFGGCCELH